MDLQDATLVDAPVALFDWRQRLLYALRRPLALVLFGAGLIGLLALLYLNQVAGVTAANADLQQLQAEQTRLDRQEAQLREHLGAFTSPAYIERRARELGLRPGPASGADIITVHGGPR
jgi:cell division protein FtsB